MHSTILLLGGLLASVTAQQLVQQTDPPVVILSTTKSGVLPVLPVLPEATPFTGLRTIQGAIVDKHPPNASYTGLGGLIQPQSNMPTATYVATMPSVMYNPATGATISGSVNAAPNSNGPGVVFNFNLQGFPSVSQYGPFAYHIHDQPVPANGDCTATLGHLDPTNVGEYIRCNRANPAACQAGDLSGKYGTINDTSFVYSITARFLTTDPNSPEYFGSKSIVIHTSNTTRLTCANFKMMTNGTASTSASTSASTGSSSTATPIQVGTSGVGKLDATIAIIMAAAGLAAALM